jgi:uncharacterized Zn finger protein
MTQSTLFTVYVLATVSTDRLQKAVNALADGSLIVTLTRQTEMEVRARVTTGQGKEYGCMLTEAEAFCSCPDALYRGVACKHATLLALSLLRMSPVQKEAATEAPPNLERVRTRAQSQPH